MVIQNPDAVVVGSGLAGLTAALTILDRGGKVVLLEKQAKPGGNSMKASSGINACVATDQQGKVSDAVVATFVQDTTKSAGSNANPKLIETLVQNSHSALKWLNDRVGVNLLEHRTRLGGHSSARTHRPAKGPVGYTVMSAMQNALKPFEESGHLETRLSTRVTDLLREDGKIVGVNCVGTREDGNEEADSVQTSHVILATGGFAADRSSDSLLARYCPQYLKMPATFGSFSTGDGIKFAKALGAGTCLMDKIQVHPTGFVDPANPDDPSKFLCAELMRGLGGILVNSSGQRFCNELGTRSYVTDQMLRHDPQYAATGQWDSSLVIPTFTLVLSADAAKAGGEHIGFYAWKKLMQPYKGISELANYIGVPAETLKATLEEYLQQGKAGKDSYDKPLFPNLFSEDLEKEEFYAGQVSPVMHYCQGGLTTDHVGNVLNGDGEIIKGLHAAGEVVGGVHGDNRLAGNSLLECLVFGKLIGNSISITQRGLPNTNVSHLTQP